jgi:hypothetical protein
MQELLELDIVESLAEYNFEVLVRSDEVEDFDSIPEAFRYWLVINGKLGEETTVQQIREMGAENLKQTRDQYSALKDKVLLHSYVLHT